MARKIAVEIVGDSSSLERAFKRSSAGASKFNQDISRTGKTKSVFGGLTKTIGLATGALGIGGLAGAARAAFTEMSDAQKVSAQTAAALKSTHGAANVSAGQIDKLATSLMNLSGVDDEAIKSSENLLLTFTNVKNQVGKGNDVFNQATKTVLDMSTALGQDTKSSAIQLGKALNDPVKGITALQRVGVSFTASQKKQIKTLVDSGHTLDAQKLILAELNKEFGGSAKAAGDTLPGKLNKLKETLLNLGGSIAEILTPQITALVNKMVDWLSKSQNQKAVLDTVKTAVSTLGTGLGILKTAFNVLSAAVGGNRNAIKLLIAAYAGFKILQIAGKVTALATTFTTLTGNMRTARGAAGGLRGSLAGKAGVAGAVVVAGVALSELIRKIPGWDKAMKDFGGSIYNVATNLGLIKDPMAQFKGKKTPGQSAMKQLRDLARTTEARGVSPKDTAKVLALKFPGFATKDYQVAAGVGKGGVVYNIANLNVHGVQNPKEMHEALTKQARQRPHPRR